MNDFLTRNWWTFVLRGAIAIVLGVLAFVVPGPTLVALIAVFAAYAIVDGVLAIIAGARTDRGPRWWFILGGIAGIAIGLFTIYSPGTTAIALVLLIGVWSIATGVAEILAGWQLRREIEGELLLVIGGVISIIFGVYLVVAPGPGVLAVLWLIGFYAIFAGVLYVAQGLRLRQDDRKSSSETTGSPSGREAASS